jgi:alkylation response protein AidB-like acyl-CoA dehydrogenase
MDLSFTDEQVMLRDTVASYLADHYSLEARRKAVAGEAGWRPQVWKTFAEELGILGASFPEDLGGLGGGPVETMILMEEFGKALVVEPFLETVVIGGGFLKHADHPRAAELIGAIIAGEAVFAFAWAEPGGRYSLADLRTTARRDADGWVLDGAKAMVVAAPWASHLIVTARTAGGERDAMGVSVFLVEADAAGVSRRDYPTVDGGRAGDITFENVRLPAEALVGPADAGLPLVEKVVDEALAALCAEACGVMRRMHEETLAYARQRKQFGVPIGSFQALQHRMADMYIHLEQSVSMTLMATLKLGREDERGRACAAAKAQIGKACRFIGQNAIQIHGGMGMTDEMAVGHYFKRATLIESALGSTDHHLARYELLSFGQSGQSG